MKLLLTSAGIRNPSLNAALVGLLAVFADQAFEALHRHLTRYRPAA